MEQKNISLFKEMDEEQLSGITGGNSLSAGEVGKAFGICTAGGAAVGAAFGSVPGAIAGGVYGAQFCTSIWALLRTH
ncbi:Blp family class II bacteriocin [Streptococcus orisratti]|uniref:Blp family class II bacteriocin n=1 Tax=Streptococcus orisratti TaxID=114652 RepID=UPI003CFE5989